MGIEPPKQNFIGDKIKMKKILNRQIIVHGYKIEKTKLTDPKANEDCLTLSIEVDKEMHIVFTGGYALIDNIKKVAIEDMPFTTTIIQENERYQFS